MSYVPGVSPCPRGLKNAGQTGSAISSVSSRRTHFGQFHGFLFPNLFPNLALVGRSVAGRLLYLQPPARRKSGPRPPLRGTPSHTSVDLAERRLTVTNAFPVRDADDRAHRLNQL